MKRCQQCGDPLTDKDLEIDFSIGFCWACWIRWIIELQAAVPESEAPTRYGQRRTKIECTCAACGQVFGGLDGFEQHRNKGRCLSPFELHEKGLRVKNGHWIRPYKSVWRSKHTLNRRGNAILGVLEQNQ